MDPSNLSKWELKISASESKVLVLHLIGEANRKMMSSEMDEMRIGCFRRTGCLITRDVNAELDALIRPQGVTVEFNIPSGETVENSDFDNVVDSALNDDGSDGLGQLSNYVQDDDEDESADLDIDGVEV